VPTIIAMDSHWDVEPLLATLMIEDDENIIGLSKSIVYPIIIQTYILYIITTVPPYNI
jgi:hypothetical protein